LGKREEADEDFRAIFGHAPSNASDKRPAQTGQAVFYDAMPVDDPKLELDVMNPHYPKYYAREETPTNWQSPVPIYFLTVAPNVRFEFAVGWRGAPNAELHQMAVEWLKGGLTELGAGAKTNAGYGYFTESLGTDESQPIRAESVVPRITRKGKIVEIHTQQHYGRVRENETQEEYRFDTRCIVPKDWTPGKKMDVVFDTQEKRVVEVRKM
jgi:CRISPR-associated protein Cmr6